MLVQLSIGQVRVMASGRIVWAEAPELLWDAVEAGELYTKSYGPETYGHTDFFLNLEGVER